MAVPIAEVFAAECLRWVGFKEKPGNVTPFGKAMGCDGEPWCAAFLASCAKTVGFERIVPQSCWTVDFKRKLRNHSLPFPGAIAWRSRGANIGHVGLVLRSGGDQVVTIEGNTNSDKSPVGGGVFQHASSLSRWNTFLFPKYPVPPQGLRRGVANPFVADLQNRLLMDIVTGVFDERTETALIRWQKLNGLQGLGVWGPKSAAAMARTFRVV